jgi:flagellar FliL protein
MVPAAAEEKAELPSSSPSISLGGGGGKFTTILTAVNTVATLAMIGVLFVSFQKEKSKQSVEDIVAHVPVEKDAKKEGAKDGEGAADKKKSVGFGKMVTLERFTVNLSTPGSATPKYVQVNISLELPTDDSESEVNMKMPQVRNVIIDLFNSKRPADLATPEGRDYIKEEIRNALNGFLVTGKVKGVFFTNFALSS